MLNNWFPSLGFNEKDYAVSHEVKIINAVLDELDKATTKFPAFASPHEGYAIIKEELDELWDDIKGNRGTLPDQGRKEAIQLAAMAIRYIRDLCP